VPPDSLGDGSERPARALQLQLQVAAARSAALAPPEEGGDVRQKMVNTE